MHERCGSFKIDGQNLAPVLVWNGVRRIAIKDGRVVDERVNLAEFRDQGGDPVEFAKIELDALANGGWIFVEREDSRARVEKGAGGGESDAARGAGDEDCADHCLIIMKARGSPG